MKRLKSACAVKTHRSQKPIRTMCPSLPFGLTSMKMRTRSKSRRAIHVQRDLHRAVLFRHQVDLPLKLCLKGRDRTAAQWSLRAASGKHSRQIIHSIDNSIVQHRAVAFWRG